MGSLDYHIYHHVTFVTLGRDPFQEVRRQQPKAMKQRAARPNLWVDEDAPLNPHILRALPPKQSSGCDGLGIPLEGFPGLS